MLASSKTQALMPWQSKKQHAIPRSLRNWNGAHKTDPETLRCLLLEQNIPKLDIGALYITSVQINLKMSQHGYIDNLINLYTAGYFRQYINNKPASHSLSIIYRMY